MRLTIADPALVLLVGPSGAGKSTFAHAHFRQTEIVSSDELRARVSDDAHDQDASPDAFRILTLLLNARLRRRLLTVVDATNLRASNRRRLQSLAARYGIPVVAVAFDLSEQEFLANNSRRPDRRVEGPVVVDQARRMVEAMAALPAEGYSQLYVLRRPPALGEIDVDRIPG